MELFIKLAVLAGLLLAVWGIVLGWSGEAVFFMDTNDLLLSFLGWIALVGSILLAMALDWRWLTKAGALVSAYFAYEAMARAHRYNNYRWAISLPVGIAKVLLSFIYIASWVEFLGPGGKNASSRRENRATALIIIGLLSVLFAKLVNGKQVFEKRGQSAQTNTQAEN